MNVYIENFPQNMRLLQVSADFESVASIKEGLLKLADEIKKLDKHHAAELWLHDYTAENGAGNIAYAFWLLDDEEVELTVDLKRDYPSLGLKVSIESYDSDSINMLEAQAQCSQQQDEVASLIEALVDELSKRAAQKILDISLKDLADKNGVEQPVVRLYFLK